MRCCWAAMANTPGSETPSRPASFADKEVHRWLAAQATTDDGVVEAGVSQEADHASASACLQLLAHARKVFADIGRRRMHCGVGIFLALALRYVVFHIALVA